MNKTENLQEKLHLHIDKLKGSMAKLQQTLKSSSQQKANIKL